MSPKSDSIKKNIANPPKTFYNGSNIALWGTFKEGLMKNFKLFLLSAVFCILIVSVAIATPRNCTAERPTCAQLGYKWECDTSKSGRYLSCPWDLSKVYCATSLTEVKNLTGEETVDCSRKNYFWLEQSNN